jgi:hypothetical protein
MTAVGDLASEAADQLMTAHVLALSETGEDVLNDQEVMIADLKKGLFSKIQFKWRSDDKRILDQIRAGVDTMFAELYTEAFAAIDGFYDQMKIPLTVEGIVQFDSGGRVIWQKDSRDQEIEDWSQLTGQDIEKTLLDITRLKLILAPQVNDLLLEAIFAKHIFDDKLHDGFTKLLEGTIPDRNAYAARESSLDKYHAFFKFYLYSHAEAFLRELNNFSRVLERIRYWRIDAQDGQKTPRRDYS